MTTTTTTRPVRATLRDVPALWRSRTPFVGNSLAGTAGDAGTLGILPEPYRATFLEHARAGRVVLVVRSYATPIAWVLDDGTEVRPAVRYSVTTSRHTGRLY